MTQKNANSAQRTRAHERRRIQISCIQLELKTKIKTTGSKQLLEFDSGSSFVNVIDGWDNEIQTLPSSSR
ncbi:hypothetical protein OUZ56_013867 [Daphnia magna]|uniref:Uncharacterized protein n=1 Tax=Daphnia magna TaxID=35525 RepID=A0ABQ9Z759_9CRUS|nr:hypothetical protein OUZ56_013867 [Daphnia magna]